MTPDKTGAPRPPVIDLNPLDASSAIDRCWLAALVWPEDRDKAVLLRHAPARAENEPVDLLAGDAVELCQSWSARIPPGESRIVFHRATRIHVPVGRRADFDRAIEDTSSDGPLYRIAIEGDGIQVTAPGQTQVRRFENDGHLGWAAPVPTHQRSLPRAEPSG